MKPGMFDYPPDPTTRRHGPCGYADYKDFKPWLRDDFYYRCVFCLLRERLCRPNGEDKFSVEHVIPKAVRPDLICEYTNLVYSCSKCNSFKGTLETLINPCDEALGVHLVVLDDGRIHPRTEAGADLIRALRLDREELTKFRSELLQAIKEACEKPEGKAAAYVRSLLSFPDELPDLKRLRPPSGNTRPAGIETCCFELRRRGELPETY